MERSASDVHQEGRRGELNHFCQQSEESAPLISWLGRQREQSLTHFAAASGFGMTRQQNTQFVYAFFENGLSASGMRNQGSQGKEDVGAGELWFSYEKFRNTNRVLGPKIYCEGSY